MPFMAWNDKLSVGGKVIDDDHKTLLGLANELYDAIGENRGKEVLGAILDRLVNYTRFHFGREEKFFAQTDYPDAARHKQEHDELVKQVLSIQERWNTGSHALTLETMTFFKDWLFDHILGSDARYMPHLNGSGIR